MFPTKATLLFYYISINIIKLLDCKRYNSLCIARDDFSRWPKARPIKNTTSKKVAKFIYKEIICRHGLVKRVKVNRGLKFKGAIITKLGKIEILRVVILAYNIKANRIIKRRY